MSQLQISLHQRRRKINQRRRTARGSVKENQTRKGDQRRPQVRTKGIKTRVDLYENSYRKVMFLHENMHRDSWQNSYRDHPTFPKRQVQSHHSIYDIQPTYKQGTQPKWKQFQRRRRLSYWKSSRFRRMIKDIHVTNRYVCT